MTGQFDKLVPSIVAVACLCFARSSIGAEGARWSYAGATGPAKWASLDKAFGLCKSGTTQSPIDIPDADARKGDLSPLLFNYKSSPVNVVDTGHTIQVNYAAGSFMRVEGKQYDLLQIEFHRPSEQKISGKGHEMEAELIHRASDGKLAIVAVMLDSGKENPLVKTVWSNLPQEKGKATSVDAVKISAVDLLPEKKDYYTYTGSLTAPPCTEEVTWFVLKAPVQISADEIARFAKVYPMNARPVQPTNGRDIEGSR